jgi:REP element-mobilizing transposase RayT
MPSGLRRFQQSRQLHFITFSCYRRQAKLAPQSASIVFENSLEQTRRAYGFGVLGYVVMPEHVHLLIGEPVTASLATALQALKQSVARRLALRQPEPSGKRATTACFKNGFVTRARLTGSPATGIRRWGDLSRAEKGRRIRGL